MELEANEETSLVRLLAINDFALHGRSLVDRSDLDLIPRLPTAERAHSDAARTEIIGVGLLFDFAPGWNADRRTTTMTGSLFSFLPVRFLSRNIICRASRDQPKMFATAANSFWNGGV